MASFRPVFCLRSVLISPQHNSAHSPAPLNNAPPTSSSCPVSSIATGLWVIEDYLIFLLTSVIHSYTPVPVSLRQTHMHLSVSAVCSAHVLPVSLLKLWVRSLLVCSQRMSHPSCSFSAGYAFLLFQEESSVQALIDACIEEDGKLYLCVSSPTIKDKPVSEALTQLNAHWSSQWICHYQLI